MKVTDKIIARINRIDTGDVFGYDALGITSDEIIAGSKALSRLGWQRYHQTSQKRLLLQT